MILVPFKRYFFLIFTGIFAEFFITLHVLTKHNHGALNPNLTALIGDSLCTHDHKQVPGHLRCSWVVNGVTYFTSSTPGSSPPQLRLEWAALGVESKDGFCLVFIAEFWFSGTSPAFSTSPESVGPILHPRELFLP